MNILFIVDVVPYPPNTGHKIRTYNIIKQLHNNGENNIFLLCFKQKALVKTDSEMQRNIAALQELCKEVHVFEIPSDKNRFTYLKCLIKNLFQFVPYRVERYRSKECQARVKIILSNNDINLLHLDKTELFEYSRSAINMPVVCTNHNVESELMRRRSSKEINLPRKLFAYLQYVKTRSYEKRTLNKVSGYITCTDLDREFIKNDLGITVSGVTIDNGVDITHYQSVANTQESIKKENFILVIGAQNKISTANYDATTYFMSEIWPSVANSNPGLKLKIVGRDPDVTISAYQEQWSNVEVCGFVQDERPYIEKAMALIVPLRVGGGSRLKIITAMAMGKAIISTSIGAEGINCTGGEDIIIEDDPELFASEITSIVRNNVLREKIGGAARRLVEEKYDWKKIGSKLRRYYEGIVNNG